MPQEDGNGEDDVDEVVDESTESQTRETFQHRTSTKSRMSISFGGLPGGLKAGGSSLFGRAASAAGHGTRKVTSLRNSTWQTLQKMTASKSGSRSSVSAALPDADGGGSDSDEDVDDSAKADEDEFVRSFFQEGSTEQESSGQLQEEAPMGKKPSLTHRRPSWAASMDLTVNAELERLREENKRLLGENERLANTIKVTQAQYEDATAAADAAKMQADEKTQEAEKLIAEVGDAGAKDASADAPPAGQAGKGKGKPPPPGKGKAATAQADAAPAEAPADSASAEAQDEAPKPAKGKGTPPPVAGKGKGPPAPGGKGPPPPGGKGPPAPAGKGPPAPAGGKGPAAPGGKGPAGKGPAAAVGSKGGKGAAKGGRGGTKASGPAIAGKKWHWKALKHQESDGTIFEQLLLCEKTDSTGIHWRVDVSLLKELFTEVAVKKEDAAKKAGAKASTEITIFDSKRTQNLAIGIVGLRNNCHTEVADLVAALLALDFESAALSNIEVIELVLTLLPTNEESKELKNVPQDDQPRLRPLEKDILQLTSVPRLPQRLRLAYFVRRAKDMEGDIAERLTILEKAARAARESQELEQFLGVSLSVGSYVNHSFLADGFTGATEGLFAYPPVGGFKLESLVRMKEMAAGKHHVGGLNLSHAVLLHLARLLEDANQFTTETEAELTLQRRDTEASLGSIDEQPGSPLSSVSRTSSRRSRTVTRRILPPGLAALKRWYARLSEDFACVVEGGKIVLVEVEDEVAELASEAKFVGQECNDENIQKTYEGPAEVALEKLHETSQELVERLRQKVDSTKQECEELCACFGEKLRPLPTALSDTTQLILSALGEAIAGVVAKGVEDLCNDKKPMPGLPEPSMLNFESFKPAKGEQSEKNEDPKPAPEG
mmetsp:Transcript_43168/g.101463  ORF Transcript_43168/g.101463 Transcript_43168/m.101463 type:complete len:889 (-) Transcript_43168:55-2721(-)